MNRSPIRAVLALALFGLILGACAPVMGGASTSEAAGVLTATYDASVEDVFGLAQEQVLRTPGWNVAANTPDAGYMRIEQTAMRARLFAAPVTVTEFVAVTISSTADGGASVSVEYTPDGASVAQNLIASLDQAYP